jgi:cellulose synthase operon protein C
MRTANLASTPLEFLDACVLMKKKEWLAASRQLELCRPLLARWPALASRTDFLLGQCYEELGDPDQQYAAYRRALGSDPFSMPASHGMGRSLVAMGRLDDAIEVYRSQARRAPGLKMIIVRLIVQRNLGLPKTQQNWNEVDATLKELEEDNLQAPTILTEIYLLKAEAAAARGNLTDTHDLLVMAREKQVDNVEVWIALANLAGLKSRAGREEALTILQEAERKFGDRVEIRLARAWYWARHGGKEASQALGQLTENIERFSAETQLRLLHEFANLYRLLGDLVKAEQFLRRLEKSQPHNLMVRLALFDIALESGNEKAAEDLIEKMRQVEGQAGARWRFGKANLLIWHAQQTGNKNGLEEAQALLTALAAERPAWPRIMVSQGLIQELLGNRESAVTRYLAAIDLGEFHPPMILRTLKLLYQSQRKMDAAKVYQKLPEQSALLGDLKYIGVDLSLHNQDYTRALALAEKAIQDSPKDYHNHLWLAHVYVAMNKQAQAEPLLREAVTLGSKAPEAWLALVQYLVFNGHKDKAAGEIRNAEKQLPPQEAALALGQCYEVIDDFDQAKAWYQKAVATQPENASALERLACLCLRLGQLKESEDYLRRIIALTRTHSEEAAAVKQLLVLVLVASGKSYTEKREALVALGMLSDTGQAITPREETIDQLRAKAMALAVLQYRPDRLAAIRILEQMRDRLPLTATDQFLLAQLYESVKEWPKARAELAVLVNKDGKNLLYLTRLAQGLLRNNETNAAEHLLAKLEELYPTADATLDIKVRLLDAHGKHQEVVELLQQHSQKNEDKLLAVALLLEELKQPTTAEDLVRRFVAKSKAPESVLVLAQFLGRQEGRIDEALDLCQKAVPSCNAATIAGVCLTILYKAKPSTNHCQLVEQLLMAAIQKQRTPVLMNYLGAFHNFQGDFAAAEADFRAALGLTPTDITALNNLSWLLAFKPGKNAEGLELANRAIKIAGPHAGLLDTRGVIHLTAGRAIEALKDLEEGVAEAPTASRYFHLAQAHQLANNQTSAMAALTEANRLGLNESGLTALERTAYQHLCVQLGMQKR